MVMNNDGYLVSENSITKNLFSSKMDLKEDASYDAVSFKASEFVYKKSNKFYMGKSKTAVNADYPLFVNHGSTILDLTGDENLITDSFETTQSYSGLYVNDGLSYNPDMEQAYREKFIMLGLPNGLFINAKTVNVRGSFFYEKTIQPNSIIRFMQNEIRYYSQKNGTFYPYLIQPLGSSSIISIDNAEYQYYDFLEKLGLYEKDDLIKQEKKNNPAPENTVTPTPSPAAEVGINKNSPDKIQQNNGDKQQTNQANMQQNSNGNEVTATPVPTITDRASKIPAVTD
jgi:hypothetical protein